MNEKDLRNNDEIEIDLRRVFSVLKAKAWLIGLVSILCAVAVLLTTIFFISPKYKSSAMFYVNNKAITQGQTIVSTTSSDMSAARSLVTSYIVILNSRETLDEIIDHAGLDITYKKLANMIEAEAVDNTEIFEVVITSEDPNEAKKLADAVCEVLPERISSIIEGSSAKVVGAANMPTKPSSPSYPKNTVIGFVLGCALMMMYVVLREIMSVAIRTEDDIAQCSDKPILAFVPDLTGAGGKSGYYEDAAKKSKQKGKGKKTTELHGPNISFAASEAYKLLRTKVLFSFAGESKCRIIGISSALTGEGKSLSAVNLSYSLSQLKKRVLLIDCDMRRPSIAIKLPINKNPGLSDYLAGQNQGSKLLQYCGIKDDEKAFHVISAGRIPPNPMELLSSDRMGVMLERLSENYDYIILDLPPVGEVGDALAVASMVDGILLVVRQNRCDRGSLKNAARQFDFVGAKLLGLVFNCVSERSGSYGKYYNYYNNGYSKYSKYSKAAEVSDNYDYSDSVALDDDAE